MRIRSVLCTLLAGTVAVHAQGRMGGLRRDESAFPKNPRLRWDRFGLYVGINEYPNVSEGDLRGCVNDVKRLRDVFRDRFGVKRYALLTDERATRAGIAGALRELVRQVSIARTKTKQPIRVVIAYAGHGGQVRDDGSDEEDGLDETWIAHDSDDHGTRDVRDDELFAVLGKLRELGAEVVLISDSCHSGTVFRDDARARTPVTRGVRRGPPRDGLFRGLEGKPDAGVVIYSACRDRQVAGESLDRHGNTCGRFSTALARTLRTVPRGTTYEDVYRRLAAEFARRWPGTPQSPQFAHGPGQHEKHFLGTDYAPDRARVIARAGDRVTVSMGRLHGVEKGATFVFEKTRGEVVAVELGTSVVRVEDDVPVGAHARLDAIRIPEFRVLVGDIVPEDVQALVARGQIRLARAGEPYDFVLGDTPAAELLRIGRQRRFLGLSCNEDRLDLRLRGKGRRENGIAVLKDGQAFRLAVTNRARHKVYVTLFAFDGDGALDILFPATAGDDPAIAPGKTLIVDGLEAYTMRKRERTWIKAVATGKPHDFRYLLRPLRTRSTRDALAALLEDTLHGTRTRSERRPPDTEWATGALVFDVVK